MNCMSCHEYGMKWKTNTGVRLWVRDSPNHHAGQDCGGSGCHSFARQARTAPGVPRPAAPAPAPQMPRPPRAAQPPARAPLDLSAARRARRRDRPVHAPAGGCCPCVSCHNGAGAGPPRTSPPSIAVGTATRRSPGCRYRRGSHPGEWGLRQLPQRRHGEGKPARHLATGAACESCHTTNAWTRHAWTTRRSPRTPAPPATTPCAPSACRARTFKPRSPATPVTAHSPGVRARRSRAPGETCATVTTTSRPSACRRGT